MIAGTSQPITRRPSSSSHPASPPASFSHSSSASLSSLFSSSYADSVSSFPPFSSYPSPSSSLASSPSLKPAGGFPPVLEHLSLDDEPTAAQISAYAAATIRNEAYALLALASRIAPAGVRIVGEGDESAYEYSSTSAEGSEASSDLSDDGAESLPQGSPSIGEPARLRGESKTNLAFGQVIRMLSSLPPHGKIVVSGVGKSGIAGRKMVATFTSLGQSCPIISPSCLIADLSRASQASRPCSSTPSRPSTATSA